jgi:hypothetical protein
MPKVEQVEKIIQRLLDGTKNGSIIWKLTQSCFNSETSHQYSTTTEDKKTTFTFEVRLDKNLKPESRWAYMYMYNDKLLDGKLQISNSDYPEIIDIQNLIYNKWVKPNLSLKNNLIVLDDILETIGDKQSRRDRILDDLLGGETHNVEETSPKPTNGLWSKIFKK